MLATNSIQDPRTNGRPRIVDDLISVILESNDHWWPRDFQRLALVSPGWLGSIRRQLYACPTLRTFHACNLFVRTVTENASLLSLVRGIDIRPVIPALGGCCLTEQDMTSLRFILSLKGLQSVTLGGELAVEAERFIQMMSDTRSVTSLHIDGSYIQENDMLCCRNPASLEWNETIAFRFTKLQSLKLGCLQLGISDPPFPYALCIADIVLDDVSICHGSIQHLCQESWGSVRRLTVSSKTNESSEDVLGDLLECCENLEYLDYDSRSATSTAHGDIFADDLPPTPLRKMRLYDVDVNPQTLITLSQIYKSLEQLSILGRTLRLKPGDWVDFLRSGALPSLRELCVSHGTSEPPSGFLPWSPSAQKLVLDQCASRGVTLSFEI